MTHEELVAAVKHVIATTSASVVVKKITSDPILNAAIQPYFGNSPAQKLRTILYGNEYSCPNGNTKTFKTLPTGYAYCGRPGPTGCKCASESVAANIKEREANLTASQKAARSNKSAATLQSKKNGTWVAPPADKSPEHIDSDVVKQFVLDNIKQYPQMIEARPRMLQWVMENSLIESDHLPSMIYSAVFQKSNICDNGKIKQFSSWSGGFIGCGIARECKCTSTNIGTNGSIALRNRTPEQIAESNAKREETMITNYGCAFNAQRDEVRETLSASKLESSIESILNDVDWLRTEYIDNKRSSVDIADELGVHNSTVIDYCHKHGIPIRSRSSYSIHELQIVDFIQSLGVEIIHGHRGLLQQNKEIDIYVPSHNFGIELNGLFWHSYNPLVTTTSDPLPKFKLKHLTKTTEAVDAGVELMHITDLEWIKKKDIIKSMIKSKLGINARIHARKCKIRMLSIPEAKQFFNNNHLQGYIHSTFYIGLEYAGEIVMAISAGSSRFDKNVKVELHRLAGKLNTNVIGGGSKLLAELKRITRNVPIVSYCDRSKSVGNGYLSMGFKLDRITAPGYFWTDGKEEIVPRYKTNHANLKKWLPSYDETLTEFDNMYNAKYRCYWDCGNLVFTL